VTAKQMDEARKEENSTISLSITPQASLPLGTDNRKNFGHMVFSHLYHELELDYFINNRRRYTAAQYNHNDFQNTGLQPLVPSCSRFKQTSE